MATCYNCGDDHPTSACTTSFGETAPRPGRVARDPWCGTCDEKTRLLDLGHSAARCQECHPLRRQQLSQHAKCQSCRKTVYVWDTSSACGSHQPVGAPVFIDKRANPPDHDGSQLRMLAAEQVAQFRSETAIT